MQTNRPDPHVKQPAGRSILTRGALVFGAAFMVGWFLFLICGIVYFELLLD